MKHNSTLPSPGDIVWCLFPQIPELEPGPKPRPALVIQVEEREDGAIVSVVCGTSQNVKRLKTGEIVITRAMHPAAYALAGLAYDTKFDFKLILDLPWSDRYFKPPPRSPFGSSPKMGPLHATVVQAAAVAYRAAMAR